MKSVAKKRWAENKVPEWTAALDDDAPPVWRWRSSSSRARSPGGGRVNAPHLIALVRAGARFYHGKLVERPTVSTAETDEVMVA